MRSMLLASNRVAHCTVLCSYGRSQQHWVTLAHASWSPNTPLDASPCSSPVVCSLSDRRGSPRQAQATQTGPGCLRAARLHAGRGMVAPVCEEISSPGNSYGAVQPREPRNKSCKVCKGRQKQCSQMRSEALREAADRPRLPRGGWNGASGWRGAAPGGGRLGRLGPVCGDPALGTRRRAPTRCACVLCAVSQFVRCNKPMDKHGVQGRCSCLCCEALRENVAGLLGGEANRRGSDRRGCSEGGTRHRGRAEEGLRRRECGR